MSKKKDRGELPNHVSVEQQSPHYRDDYTRIGVKLGGIVLFDVIEFNVAEGWLRRHCKDGKGNLRRERGRLVGTHHTGKIELYWRA